MPFLPQDRWRTLQSMGITDPGESAIVAMLEIQTELLKEIRDAVGGGSGQNDLQEIAQNTGLINTTLEQLRTNLVDSNNVIAADLTNINDTLEDIYDKMPGPPGPP